MEQQKLKSYGYRWVVLLVFMLVTAVNQLLWITFAPITGAAAEFYGVSELGIGLLSMSFMIVYIVVSIPASWLTKVTAFGIAIGQPLILNAVTLVAARWFPIEDRATASGFGSLAMYLGIVLSLALTPYLVNSSSINTVLLIYGIVAVVAAVLFWILAREHPPTPASPPGQEERALVFDGLRQVLRKRDFIVLMVVFFIGLGVFNSVTTWIEEILAPRGFAATQAGLAGALMVIGGVVGAVILPSLSDHYRKRVPFILCTLAGATIGLVGVTFATSYALLLAAAFVMGFFLLSAGPIGFQYGVEIAYPAPEGTSNGLLLLMGQISGILFILAMDSFRAPGTGSMTTSLLVMIGLMVLGLLLSSRLKESSLLTDLPTGLPTGLPTDRPKEMGDFPAAE